MSAAALKRVERFIGWPVPLHADERVQVAGHGFEITVGDLRTVLALAKQAAELKRRIGLARKTLGCPGGDEHTRACVLLDLRKPLPKGRGR